MKNEKFLTRATFRLMALLLCLSASIPQLQADVTIFVRGTAPYLHVFNISGTAPTDGSSAWPGVKMTQSTTSSDGTTWYYVNYEGLNSCSIIFSNGSGGNNNQTWDITNVSGTKYYYSNGSNYYLDLTTVKDESNYVFFERPNTNDWNQGTMCAHCWNGSYSTTWPGDEMTFVGGANGGSSVFAWFNSSAPGMIIFNNKKDNAGNQQTGDLTYYNGRYYYNYGNSTNTNYVNLSFPTLPLVVADTYVVAGPSSIFGSNWDGTASANSMTKGSNGNYTLALYNVSLTASTSYEYKVVKNGSQWIPSGDNLTFNVPLNGTYNITFTFNPTTNTCEATYSLQTATGGETYTVAGSNTTILGSSWNQTDSNNDMTLGNGIYQLTFNDVVLSDDNPSCEFKVVVNHSWVTAYPTGNASVSGFNGSGTYDIVFTYDPSDNSVTGVATKQVIYYVVGDEDLIGHDWTIANDAAMTNNSWTKTGIHLNMGTYNLKVKDSDGNWYGNSNGDNVTVTADENGTYTLTVTRDASTGVVSATLTRTATDATQTYNIYVRYTGNEDPENVRLHAWNAVTSYDSWPGVQFSTMTTQVINGHTYYKYTITNTTATSIGLQFNENGSSSTQTANLTAQPGDSYFTYGGGSTVTGPNNAADGLDTYYIEGSEGLGLTWGYAPTTQMTYDDNLGYYKYTCTVEADGTYNFFFANGQGSDWNDFNNNYRIGPQSGDQAIAIDNNWVATQMAQGDGGNYQINVAAGPVTIYFNPATMQFKVDATAPSYQYTFYIYPSDGTTTPHIYLWDNAENVYTNAYPGNQVTVTEQLEDGKTWFKYTNTILVDVLNAIISAGGSNADNTKTKNITNFEPGTYYIVWDPVRANGDEYNHFELYNDPPTAVGEHQLFIHGGYYHEGQTYNYASDSGSEMKYYRNPNNPDEEYYYINNITLSSNSTFCFTTLLGNDWQNVGIRYGNGGGNGGTEYTDNPNGTNYLEVNESRINTMMPLGVWSETYGEFKMFTAGVYNILASPSGGWVKLIKTDHKSLSPMNVYLEQTPNVEINNIQEPGTTYTTAMFSGYWPLSAYNQEQGGWDPNSDSQHYPVTYIGDTTTVDGKKWWHWQVNASIAEVFFTRTNDKNPKQSEAIVRHAGVLWYTWDEINGQTVMTDHTREYFEAAANALPSNVVVMEGHYYVYFINTLGWDRVFCYAWDEADGQYTDGYNRVMEVWPGHICELMGIDPVTGYEVWRYDLGTISSIENAPDGILFNDGDTNALSDSKEQTGDFEYINGGVYDYLGLFDGSYTLNNLIRTAAEDVRYTVSNDLLGVYYDPNVKTAITYKNKYDEDVTETVIGALYAKDLNQYGEKSLLSKIDESDGKTYTDYVYGVCASNRTPGGSQIMVNKTAYDQSNWIKLIMSPNYDGRNPTPVASNERPALSEYVNCIIPAGTLDVFMTDTINPTAHVLAIKKGEAMTYEPNVYISGNFNDTVVFNYTHRDWQPKDKDGKPAYKGNMRTKPVITWNYDATGKVTGGTVTREAIEEDPYYMFFVAPKPQEIAYITWVVYDNKNTNNEWPGYRSDTYQPYTNPNSSDTPPADPGSFFAPMNWDRSIKLTGKDYENMQYMSETQVEEYLAQGAHAAEYGNYYNGYMQYGGVKVNWSLFNIDTNNAPWWHIFTPGQAYKFKAIIRYARGNGEIDGVSNSTNNFYYGPGISDYDQSEDYHYDDPLHINHAPLREASSYANVYFTKYDHLDESKFIIFPIRATASRSNGDGIGNVTSVQEVIADVNVPRDIVAVKYYNMMGIESDKPFDGINIIVTFYSDGSRSSRKVLR